MNVILVVCVLCLYSVTCGGMENELNVDVAGVVSTVLVVSL